MSAPDAVEFLGDQILLVDPRAQGFGLEAYDFIDPYANKFYVLSGSNGAFVSPCEVPAALHDYYTRLGIDIASSDNTITLEPTDAPIRERLHHDEQVAALLDRRRGSVVVPYMLTEEVSTLADRYDLGVLSDPATVDYMGDKANFQFELKKLAGAVMDQVGFDVGIAHQVFTAADNAAARDAYDVLSEGGRKNVVIVKPRSASALGLFVVKAEQGFAGMQDILRENFGEDEKVLLEEFVSHTESPSMQGFGLRGGDYTHMYFGRQIISQQDGKFTYDAHEIPFSPPQGPVDPSSLEAITGVHQTMGATFLDQNIGGVAGVDAVVSMNAKGRITSCKFTEVNLHLPGSLATYAAMKKVFPNGFGGIAHNTKVRLRADQTSEEFFEEHQDGIIGRKGEYGMFPLNMSGGDKVDVVLFARDNKQLGIFLEAAHA